MSTYKKLMTVCAAAVLALGLAACGGGDDDDTADAPVTIQPVPPTPYQMALNDIADAATPAEAQAAYDAVKDDVTATEGDALQDAVDERVAALMAAARAAMQRQNLMAAAGGIDTSDLATQAEIDAAQAAIDALQAAIDAAADVDDTSMYQTMVDNAQGAVDMAQTALDTSNATMARMAEQRMALTAASAALTTALGGLSGTPTQAQIDAAQDAVDALQAAIDGAADLDDTSMYEREVAVAEGRITSAESTLAANNDAQEEQDRKDAEAAAAAMAATAAKLYAGIANQNGSQTNVAAGTALSAGERAAAYNDADQPTAGTAADTRIMVGIGTAAVVALSEDKDTTVAALDGWAGKRYARTMPAAEGMYEAIVYSHVGDPTQGNKFGQIGVTTAATGYQYGLDADGILQTDVETTPSQVASPSFDQSAGVKEFERGTNTQYVSISGTYHGVAGEYRCTPADNSTCAAQVATQGFNLGGTADADNAFTAGGGTWTFKPSNTEARVTDTPDGSYASYGWWIHMAANDGDFTASAFVDRRGAAEAAEGLDDLNGTATYMGGAAGKYALSSTTGGTNDAGHFTARATLTADFTNNTDADAISGTIDQFVGADGEPRDDWSVKLNGSTIGDTGVIGAATNGTEWTIGGTAADDSGNWTGSLQENGDDGVPAIATGTFYSEYGTAGKMVGAFGANKQ